MYSYKIHIEGEQSKNFSSRMKYTLSFINNHPISKAIKASFKISSKIESDIIYGYEREDSKYFIPRQNMIFEDKKIDYLINEYEYEFDNSIVHSVETLHSSSNTFHLNGLFGFDVFEMIFYHISRFEETYIKQSDFLNSKYEFEKKHLLIKNKLEKRPVVDNLIESITTILTKKTVETPNQLTISHDIDHIEKYKSSFTLLRNIAGHIRHGKPITNFPLIFKSWREYRRTRLDPFDTFEWMLSKKAIEKSIYFLVGGNHKNDTPIKPDHPTFLKALKLSQERGYKIGIHPSYSSWNNEEMMIREKEVLENVVGSEIVISRQHYLNFDVMTTPRILQNIGIREDSSLGYTRHVGYRCGTAFPYFLYDFKNEKAFDVIETPLVFMDSAWFFEIQRNNSLDSSNQLTVMNGCYNFHNSSFDEFELKGLDLKEMYKALIY